MIRTIHTFWDGPETPEYVTEYVQAWRDLHPDWEVIVWNDESVLSELLHGQPELTDLYLNNEIYSPKSNKYQYRTNIARVLMLHQFGGLWADADLKPLKNVEPLLDAEIVVAREDKHYCNNGFLYAATPGTEFFSEYLRVMPERIKRNPSLRSNRQCGPHLVTDLVAKHPEVKILPKELIYPYSWSELDQRDQEFPEAYTVHLWRNAMTREGLL